MEDQPPQKQLRLEWRFWTVAKDVDFPDENEDVVCVDGDRARAAIADGVTSSLYARTWAAILAEAAIRDHPDAADREELARWLAKHRAAWQRTIDEEQLAWFQKAKLREGAFSTLLAIRLVVPDVHATKDDPSWRLQGIAIGDSCLFHVRGGQLLRKFPIQASAELQNYPMVLGSIDLSRDEHVRFHSLDTPCREGDLVVLCTDALADWALRREESGSFPCWEEFWDMDATGWQERILALRAEREIRCDDTTLVLLRIVEAEQATGENG